MDFTAYETTAEGIRQMCPVVDDPTKVALACSITLTQSAANLLGAPQSAVGAAEALLSRSVVEDCTDPATGEIVPPPVATDHGSAMKSVAVARWFAARSHLARVQTRQRAPWTNSVVER